MFKIKKKMSVHEQGANYLFGILISLLGMKRNPSFMIAIPLLKTKAMDKNCPFAYFPKEHCCISWDIR